MYYSYEISATCYQYLKLSRADLKTKKIESYEREREEP